MNRGLTRREFLRSAGGITFLALAPVGRGLFAASADSLPTFTALPYVQPGGSGTLTPGRESMRLLWQTSRQPAEFALNYGADESCGQIARIERAERLDGGAGHFNYTATLDGLSPGKRYLYEVKCNGALLAKGYLTTRQPRGERVRFAAFGDNSYGGPSDHAIAFQAYQAHPDFIMNTGDNVYQSGLDGEYARYFFPVYNADVPGSRLGAPLLRSVPFYSVLANHDVRRTGPAGGPAADFSKDPDSLGFYTNFHLPLNGPDPAQPTPILGPDGLLDAFRACAGARFPRMANYSYDYGDIHFLCLDSNLYVNPSDPALQSWVENDLSGTDARWKFVVYHHPCFNVGHEHWEEQQMRVLCPLLEKHGVDFVLSGHEHNYQRTRPLRFQPGDAAKAAAINEKDRQVGGAFTVDRAFDGTANTRPDGILYITTGAGGNTLYDADYNNNPSKWRLPGDPDYVVRMVSDRHSLTVFDIDGNSLLMRQIDEFGHEIDRLSVAKKG